MKHPILAVLAFAITAMVPARADVLTYTFSTTGTGTLDGNNFTNQPLTVSMTANTLSIEGSASLFILPGTFGVIVPGTGGDLFTGSISEFDSADDIIAAVAGNGPGLIPDLLGVQEGTLNYNFQTAVGPITSTGIFSASTPYATTAGTFDLTAIGSVTFTAVDNTPPTPPPTPTPEPGSLLLLGSGVSIFLYRIRRYAKIETNR